MNVQHEMNGALKMWTMIEPSQALDLVLSHAKRLPSLEVPLPEASGLALADAIVTHPGNGEVQLAAGTDVDGLVVALLALQGCEHVRVVPPPCVASVRVASENGSETDDASCRMLQALVKQVCGAKPAHFEATNTPEDLAFILDHVSAADLILLSGDERHILQHLAPEAAEHYGAGMVFHGVLQDPGGPLFLAVRGRQLLFGLPDEMAGMHLCFHRYVAPAIRGLMGRGQALSTFSGRLAAPLSLAAPRSLFLLARAEESDGARLVRPLTVGGKLDLGVTLGANAYLGLPPGDHALPGGTDVTCQWI